MRYVFVIFVIFISLVLIVIYYLYNQLSYIPESNLLKHNITSENIRYGEVKISKLNREVNAGKAIRISEQDFNDILIAVADKIEKKYDVKFINAVYADFNSNRISIETILNLKNLPAENVPGENQNFLDNIVRKLPQESFENFYVKIEGNPEFKNGKLKFSEDTKLSLGSLSYAFSDIHFGSDSSGTFNIQDVFGLPLTRIAKGNLIIDDNILKIIP